ncbi:phage portal protein [Actinomadura oligospora]|uniref:phage portal protein n=1 Tax=Actinomadura oligospora TaxID=111804 RepID=UPI0014741906|nr:phage portal protein [Actinomadura oligospora]
MEYLSGRLHTQSAKSKIFRDAYDAENQDLKFAQQKFTEVFGDLFHGWRDNFSSLIVDSISERLSIRGFRMGPDEDADKDALDIWQRSFLDADSNAAHIDALVQGVSFLSVWIDDEGQPTITPESASEMVVQYAPGSRRQLEAAYREYQDDWGVIHSVLYLDTAEKGINGVYKVDRNEKDSGWSDPKKVQDNPFKSIPVVPLLNRKRLKSEPYSELAAVLPIQNAINKVSADAIVASEFGAFPQRVITGLEPFDDSDEERQAMLKAYVDRILTFDGEDVKFGQFEPADLGNYVKLIDMLVQHMASQSRVPFHYFLLNGGQAPSGESITSAEAGLVAKARERMLHFGESWEMAMRLAFEAMDDPRAEAWGAEVIWGDPEHRAKATLVDSLIKLKELDIPVKQLQEDYGYSPQQIARFIEMKEAELKQQHEWQQKYMPEPAPGTPGQPATAGQKAQGTSAARVASVERQKAKEQQKAA